MSHQYSGMTRPLGRAPPDPPPDLSPSTVLYIPIDACGDYFSTSRMCSTSCTSGLYLRVWGLVGRYAGGGLLRVVRLFFRPARPPKRLGQVPKPPPDAAKSEITIAGWRSMVRSIANFGMTFEPGWRSRSTSFPVNGAAWSCLSCLSPLSHRVLIHFR